MGALIGWQGGKCAALAHVTTRLAAAVVRQFKLIRASWNLRIWSMDRDYELSHTFLILFHEP